MVVDSSVGGWQVVKEMEKGKIFDDDEEAKVLWQAEKAVLERRWQWFHPYRKQQKPFQSTGGLNLANDLPIEGQASMNLSVSLLSYNNSWIAILRITLLENELTNLK